MLSPKINARLLRKYISRKDRAFLRSNAKPLSDRLHQRAFCFLCCSGQRKCPSGMSVSRLTSKCIWRLTQTVAVGVDRYNLLLKRYTKLTSAERNINRYNSALPRPHLFPIPYYLFPAYPLLLGKKAAYLVHTAISAVGAASNTDCSAVKDGSVTEIVAFFRWKQFFELHFHLEGIL